MEATMHRTFRTRSFGCFASAGFLVLIPWATAGAESIQTDVDELKLRVEALSRDNAAMQGIIEDLRSEIRHVRDEAKAARDTAETSADQPTAANADVSAVST
jgi:FtsZ-binding cell division protein ZapB